LEKKVGSNWRRWRGELLEKLEGGGGGGYQATGTNAIGEDLRATGEDGRGGN
jgi:hypothetical protein